MVKTAAEMVADARAEVPSITVDDAASLHGRDDVVFLDVRETDELRASGKVPGAVAVPRGSLEFKADPAAPTHDPNLAPGKTVIVYCAAGGRAALAGATLKALGFGHVRNMGGFKDWAEKGLPVDKV